MLRRFLSKGVVLDIQRRERKERSGFKIISTRHIIEAKTPLLIQRTEDGKVVAIENDEWCLRDEKFEWFPLTHEKEWCIFYGWYYFRVGISGTGTRAKTIKKLLPLNTGKAYIYHVLENGKKRVYTHCTIMTMMLQRVQTKLNYVIDREFCDKGELIEPEHPKNWEKPQTVVDEEVYQRFRKYMNLCKNPQNEKCFSGKPTVLAHGLRLNETMRVYRGMKGEEDVPWYTIDGDYSYGVVYKKPTRDGKLRKVFPMSPKTNAFITQEYGKQNFILPNNVKQIYGCKFRRMKYSYDVKKCDGILLPYFKRLLEETYPEDVKRILGPVKYMGENYELPQFPSGICVFMQYVPMCFTVAYLDLESYDNEFQVQGDGVFSNVELKINNLQIHENPNFTINGFYYDESNLPHYVNGDAKLTTPQILGTTKIRGEMLWKFRREIYRRFLKAKITVVHHVDELGELYENVTDKQLFEMMLKADVHIAKVCQVLEAHGEDERLEIAKIYLSDHEYRGYWKSLIWEGNPSVGYLG